MSKNLGLSWFRAGLRVPRYRENRTFQSSNSILSLSKCLILLKFQIIDKGFFAVKVYNDFILKHDFRPYLAG